MKNIKIIIILSLSLLFHSCLTKDYISKTDWVTTIESHITNIDSAYVTDSSIIVIVEAKIKNQPWNKTMYFELPLDSFELARKYIPSNYKREIGNDSLQVVEQYFQFKHKQLLSRKKNVSRLRKLDFIDLAKDKRIKYIISDENIFKSIKEGEIPNEFLTWHSYTRQKNLSHTTFKYYKFEGDKLILNIYRIALPPKTVMPLSAIPNMLLIPVFFILDLAWIILIVGQNW